jgi:hypothetical protein
MALAPVGLWVKNAAVDHKLDTSAAAWEFFSAVLDQMFYSPSAWVFWLIAGLLIGNWVSSHLLAAQQRFYGQAGSQRPGEIALNCRWMRWAIRWPAMRRFSGDFEADIRQLNVNLTGDPFRMPALPCLDFEDETGMMKTEEYLRLVQPLMRKNQIDTARRHAEYLVGSDQPKTVKRRQNTRTPAE